jgi:hypothetical protein
VIAGSIRIPVPYEFAFPNGCLFLGVDKLVDFDRLTEPDNQARDENGVRLWVVKVSDQDPQAGRFGRSNEVKVKIAAQVQPVPPDGISLPGGITVTPVEFLDLVATPYVETTPCKGIAKPHKCKARQAWSYRASGMAASGTVTGSQKAA